MEHVLPPLPYPMDALVPYISQETLEYHYNKHHQTYVNNLNNLIRGGEFEDSSLENIMKQSSGSIFNSAAQVWNHTFYWNSLSPEGGGEPKGNIADGITSKWGTFEEFKNVFNKAAMNNFGSGWTWLVKRKDNVLDITNTSNASNPIVEGTKPLLTCDVWEHAYYIDYRNSRQSYLENFWALVNWSFASKNLG